MNRLFLLAIALASCLLVAIGGFVATIAGAQKSDGRSSLAFLQSNPGWKVVNVEPYSSHAKGYNKILQRSRIVKERAIVVESHHTLDQLEEIAGAKVAGLEQAAHLLAPKLAEIECRAILSTLAQSCIVEEVWIREGRSSRVKAIELKLLYIERDEFGTVVEGKPLSYVETKPILGDNGGRGVRMDMRNQAALRQEFYRAAAHHCRKQRALYGNCAVQDIWVRSVADFDGTMVEMLGYVTLATLQEQKTFGSADMLRAK